RGEGGAQGGGRGGHRGPPRLAPPRGPPQPIEPAPNPGARLFQRIPLPEGGSLALDATAPRHARGTTLVYLHGLGSDRGGEKARFLEERALERGLGYARFDFPGHGDSAGRFEKLTLTRHLEDLAAVLGHLGSGAAGRAPGRVVLVGASLGAVVAAWHALLHPGTIAAQVLIAPAFRIIERYLDALGEF